jgi:hypothetical protein
MSSIITKLIQEAFKETKAIPNYNKPNGAILTCCFFDQPTLVDMQNHPYMSKLYENSRALLLYPNNTWVVKVTSSLTAEEIKNVKAILYAAHSDGCPCDQKELLEIAALTNYKSHLDILNRICEATEKMVASKQTSPLLSQKTNEEICLLQTFAQAAAIRHIKKGNCGDLCRVVAESLIRSYATEKNSLIPIELFMATYQDFSHVFLILNRNPRSDVRDIATYGNQAWILDPYNNTFIKATDLKTDTGIANHLLRVCFLLPCKFACHLSTLDNPHGGGMKRYIQKLDDQCEKILANPGIKYAPDTISQPHTNASPSPS